MNSHDISLSLKGLSILVTRPGEAGLLLCDTIRKDQGQAVFFPVLAIAEILPHEMIQEKITALAEQDWIIFMSPQAVKSGLHYIHDINIVRKGIRIAAVGEKTAHALKAAGIDAVTYPKTEWSSEAILALPELQFIQGKKIAIIRGANGRDLIDGQLTKRGAQVLSLVVYKRVLPLIDNAPIIAHLSKKQIHVILASSFDTVRYLCQLVGHANWPQLKAVPLVVMSERVKQLAIDMGFNAVWVANTADYPFLLQLLRERRNQLCKKIKLTK